MKKEVRQAIQRLWCQHCKALQESNRTPVDCWYRPLEHGRDTAFCSANDDAVQAIAELLET